MSNRTSEIDSVLAEYGFSPDLTPGDHEALMLRRMAEDLLDSRTERDAYEKGQGYLRDRVERIHALVDRLLDGWNYDHPGRDAMNVLRALTLDPEEEPPSASDVAWTANRLLEGVWLP